MLLLRKVDRSGVLDDIDDVIDDISLITGLPSDVVTIGMGQITKSKTVTICDNRLIMPNFIEAQEASKSDKQRQRESRERRRSQSMVTKSDNKSQVVTSGHGASQPVTLSCAVPTCAEPMQTNTKPINKYNPKAAVASIEWIDSELWSEWIDYKRKVKASVTKRAIDANLKKLEGFGRENANAIIAQSLDSGWKDLFPLKAKQVQHRQTGEDRQRAQLETIKNFSMEGFEI
jgi:hypothetical protein